MTSTAQKRQALANTAALAVARGAFAAKAIQAAEGRGVAPLPKGMRGSGIYRRETNAVTLDPVPTRRAVKIGKQYWNSRTLRGLLKSNPAVRNPLTRQPLPQRVVKKYGPMSSGKLPSRNEITKVDDAIEVGRIARHVLSGSTPEERSAGTRMGLLRTHWELTVFDDFKILDVWERPRVRQRQPLGYFKMIGEGANRILVFHYLYADEDTEIFKQAARRGGDFITFHRPRPLRGGGFQPTVW